MSFGAHDSKVEKSEVVRSSRLTGIRFERAEELDAPKVRIFVERTQVRDGRKRVTEGEVPRAVVKGMRAKLSPVIDDILNNVEF